MKFISSKESLVKTKRWVADTEGSWPEEAVRRAVLKLLFDAGFDKLPAVVVMPDRLAAYVLAHVAQDVEEEQAVYWAGDIEGSV